MPHDVCSGDARWLQCAIQIAVRNAQGPGGPFGAVVVLDGQAIGQGGNRVVGDNDPTAHAEVVAIRAACREISGFSLAGATLFASCEPCPLCFFASLWARLDRIVYAADRQAAARVGFDDARFHALMCCDDGGGLIDLRHVEVPGSERPFEAWLRNAARVHY